MSLQIICIKFHPMWFVVVHNDKHVWLLTNGNDFFGLIENTTSSFSADKRWTMFVIDNPTVERTENRLSIIVSLSAWLQPKSEISAWMTRSANYSHVRFRGISAELDDIISCRLGWSRRNISLRFVLARACALFPSPLLILFIIKNRFDFIVILSPVFVTTSSRKIKQ